jgi:hypothetical protein
MHIQQDIAIEPIETIDEMTFIFLLFYMMTKKKDADGDD